MQVWFRRFVLFLAAIGGIASIAPPASAHPHVYIDMKTAFHFDAKGQLDALRIVWIFDEFYSAFALDGAPKTDNEYDAAFLAELAAENLKNLAEWNYFTEVTSDGAPIDTAAATDALSEWDENTGRLSLSFTLPLKEPYTVSADRPLDVRIFDPSYYISIDYLPGDPVSLTGGPHDACSIKMNTPEVEQVWTALPESAFTDPNSTLGANFASTVTLVCAPGKS